MKRISTGDCDKKENASLRTTLESLKGLAVEGEEAWDVINETLKGEK